MNTDFEFESQLDMGGLIIDVRMHCWIEDRYTFDVELLGMSMDGEKLSEKLQNYIVRQYGIMDFEQWKHDMAEKEVQDYAEMQADFIYEQRREAHWG